MSDSCPCSLLTDAPRSHCRDNPGQAGSVLHGPGPGWSPPASGVLPAPSPRAPRPPGEAKPGSWQGFAHVSSPSAVPPPGRRPRSAVSLTTGCSSPGVSHPNPGLRGLLLAHSSEGGGLGWRRRGGRALERGEWDFCQRHGRDSKPRNGRTTQSRSSRTTDGEKDTDGARITAVRGRGHPPPARRAQTRAQESPAPHATDSRTHAHQPAGGGWGLFSLYNWHLKPLWQMEENYVIKADILLSSLGLLILLSFTGKAVPNGNQPVAACGPCRADTGSGGPRRH